MAGLRGNRVETKATAAQEAKYNEYTSKETSRKKNIKALVLLKRQNEMKNRQESFQQFLAFLYVRDSCF